MEEIKLYEGKELLLFDKDLVNQKYNKEVVIKDEYLYQLTGTLTKNWPYA